MLRDEQPSSPGPEGSIRPLAPLVPEPLNGHPVTPPTDRAITIPARAVALIEVLLCSDVPTQLLLMQVLAVLGIPPRGADGRLSMLYVWTLSFADAILLIALIVFFLRVHGEPPRDLLLGRRPVCREIGVGLLLTPVIFLFTLTLLAIVLGYVPWLRNVPMNPLADLIRTPQDAWLFCIIAVFAGGVREEIQRAFILRRFEQYLGGPIVGVAVFSVAFGAGHLIQGWDVAIITASLGAIWGIVYLRRRSIVAPVVSHSLFNLSQVLQHTLFN